MKRTLLRGKKNQVVFIICCTVKQVREMSKDRFHRPHIGLRTAQVTSGVSVKAAQPECPQHTRAPQKTLCAQDQESGASFNQRAVQIPTPHAATNPICVLSPRSPQKPGSWASPAVFSRPRVLPSEGDCEFPLLMGQSETRSRLTQQAPGSCDNQLSRSERGRSSPHSKPPSPWRACLVCGVC